MKYLTLALFAVLILGLGAPITHVSARSDHEESFEDGSHEELEDQDDDSNEAEDHDDDSNSRIGTSTNHIITTTATDSRIKLLQELITRLIALLNELKGISPTSSTPTTTPVTTPTAQTYTAAVVATHNTSSSCWSIINSKVYDLTSYVPLHPGGSQNILKLCGKDGTAAFTSQHGGSSAPANALSRLYLAPLAH